MKTTFLHRNYAEANPDLAELFGNEDETALREHYENYGAVERRGVNLEDYLRVETVLLSEEGHLFLSGWADRRMVETGCMRWFDGSFDRWDYERPHANPVIAQAIRALY